MTLPIAPLRYQFKPDPIFTNRSFAMLSMKYKIYLWTLTLSLLTANIPTQANDLYTLIVKGEIKTASDSLSKLATASVRDGNILFYQSLLETDAAKSKSLMTAALNAGVIVRYQEEIYYRLAQYYLVSGDMKKLSQLLNEYRSRWENGRYNQQMRRFSVGLAESEREYNAALNLCDKYLIDYASGEAHQYGLLDKARIMKANRKGIGASKMLRKLSRADSGEGIPQALYLLADDAVSRNRTDDGVFFYNILREGYPTAVGLDDLIERLSGISSGSSSQAEKLTGTFYSVKVGVFSSSSNAKKHAKVFRKYKKKIEIKSKVISGQKYSVVYVGRFQDYEEAAQFRIQLEATHNEAFQVVTR